MAKGSLFLVPREGLVRGLDVKDTSTLMHIDTIHVFNLGVGHSLVWLQAFTVEFEVDVQAVSESEVLLAFLHDDGNRGGLVVVLAWHSESIIER